MAGRTHALRHGSCFPQGSPVVPVRAVWVMCGSVPLMLEVRAMYSVVLLMALSGGADTPAFGFGCKGCSCSSGCGSCSCSSCCDGCWSSCACSSSCHKSRMHKSRHGGHGCCGG